MDWLGLGYLVVSVAALVWWIKLAGWLFTFKIEQEWQACNRVMGTSFADDAEYKASRFGGGKG